MDERDARLRGVFSRASLAEQRQCDGIFQWRNINFFPFSRCFYPLPRARKYSQGRCQWVVSSALLPTSRAASAEKSFSFKRKERNVHVERRREGKALLIEGFSINVSRRKGIIFSATKRPFQLFLAIFLEPPLSLPSFRGILLVAFPVQPGNLRAYRRVFPVVFL